MISEDKVRSIGDTQSLISFMSKELDWELPSPAAIDELTFEWTGTELSLSDDIVYKLKGGSIKQIQPLRREQPWGVFLVDFAGSRVYTTALRQVLRRLVPSRRAQKPDMPAWHCQNILFICTTENRQFTFAHFCGEKPERARLTTFSWTPQEPIRTLCEFNLPALSYDSDWNDETWLREWQSAFDVEKVTSEFFRQYHHVFELVEEQIQGFVEPERKRLFTQRLFNRLMFIAFIQKKGWLKFNSQTNYLAALWEAYRRGISSKTNFYRDRLQLLFFSGLNTPNDVNIIDINRGGFLKNIIGDVPYLNGGLFEEDDDDHNSEVVVPDECIEAIFNDLFNRFNFTVTESTPLDIEVAVDPEMLGRVFEELVTGRHETGSYYTPKPVVSFMGREALKGYLRSALPGESPAAIYLFVEERDPAGLRNPETVLGALRRVKVCDPACGSGAYLLGMLHELLDLRTCLFATKNLDPISAYERKLEIIQNNLYGVDLDPFAVNIARLRLWLSLAVEFEGSHPSPLPNLDFKVETGDSLTAPDPSTGIQGSFRQHQIEDFLRLKAAFMTAHGGEKLTLREQINNLKAEISAWTHGGKPVIGFDWPVEFAEVFTRGGFDSVLANPPYVRADAQFKHIKDENERQLAIEKWKDYRAALLKSGIYKTLYEKWDLYLPFLERAHQLLRKGGRMVFIISDSYNSAKYANKSHELFFKNSSIERIDFCTDIPLFEAGISNTIVHFAKASPDTAHQPTRVRRWGESRDDFERNSEVLATAPQLELGIALFRGDGARTEQIKGFILLWNLCYISYGLRANADDRYWQGEFTTDDCLSPNEDRTHLKPFVQGKDLVKWRSRRVWYLEWGTARAPKKFSRPTFPALHEAKVKLLAMKNSGAEPKCVYDDNQTFFDSTVIGFVPWYYLKGVRNKSIQKTVKYRNELKHNEISPPVSRENLEELSRQFIPKYLLAVINSTFAREWLTKERRHKISVYPDDWKELPVAPATLQEQSEIVALVDKILVLYSQHGHPLPPHAQEQLRALEQQIDEKVAALYEQ